MPTRVVLPALLVVIGMVAITGFSLDPAPGAQTERITLSGLATRVAMLEETNLNLEARVAELERVVDLLTTAPNVPGPATPTALPGSAGVDPAVLARIATVRDQAPIYREVFAEDRGLWTTGEKAASSTFIADGALHVRLGAGLAGDASFSGLEVDNFLLETSVRPGASAADYTATILFRVMDQGMLYAFQARSTGSYAVSKIVDGEPTQIVPPTVSAAIRTGNDATNRLAVLADGPVLAFVINDVVVQTLTDDAIGRGVIGLGASAADEEGVEIAFDDLTVWQIGEAHPPAATPTQISRPDPRATPASTATATPLPTPTRGPLTLEDLPIDWSGLEEDFLLTNIRIEERTRDNSAATYQYLAFDAKAKYDLGIFIYMAEFYDENGELLANANVEFTLDADSLEFTDSQGGWNTGAHGRVAIELPHRLSTVNVIKFSRLF